MSIRRVGPDDLAAIEPLIQEYAFKPFRNYRVLSRKAQADVLRAEVADTLAHADGIAFAIGEGLAQTVAIGRVLAWESEFFAVPMARVEYLLALDRTQLVHVLNALLEAFGSRGVRHVSVRLDVADIQSMALTEAAGFRLMDCLVTYTARPKKEAPFTVRDIGTIRDFRPEDGEELVQIAAEAYRGFRGRFHLDAHLPADRSDAFYAEWARQSVAMTMADTMLVSEGADGRLLGFLGFRRREPVSSVSGVPLFGGGLGACRRDAPGAYAGLIRAGTLWAHARNGVAECQTQNYNFSTIRIYEAVGLHYVRAEYTLHAWLG